MSRVNGVPAAVPAESGKYAALPEVQASRQATRGVSVNPKACARVALTGFDSAVLASAPAAAVTFRVGGNGVSEVLVAPATAAASALGSRVPAMCEHYTATVGVVTVVGPNASEVAVRELGQQAYSYAARSLA